MPEKPRDDITDPREVQASIADQLGDSEAEVQAWIADQLGDSEAELRAIRYLSRPDDSSEA